MTNVNGVNQTANTGIQTNSTEKKKNLGQEDFLQLLVAQMRNQNPLEPQTNGDFMAQMAQFGTVDGIKNMESLLKDLSNALQSNQTLQASTLVGRKVVVPAHKGELAANGNLSGQVDLPHSVSNLSLSFYNAQGELIHRQDLGLQPAGKIEFNWDGKKSDGTNAAAGVYHVKAEGLSNGQSTSFSTYIAANVDSVTLGKQGEGLTLHVAGVGTMSLEQIVGIK